MIYDPFRAARAYDAEQDLSDLSNINRHDGDIQDFDTIWDKALLTECETPKEISWRVCTDSRYETLFSFRLYELSANKKLIETVICRVTVPVSQDRHALFTRGSGVVVCGLVFDVVLLGCS